MTGSRLPDGYRVERINAFFVILHHPGGSETSHQTEEQANAFARGIVSGTYSGV